MFQLYLSCLLLMARAAPPLDTLDTRDREELGEVLINIETPTLGHIEELEDITKKNIEVIIPSVPLRVDESFTEVPQDNFINITKEEDNDDGGELISAQHDQDDIAENLISIDNEEIKTIDPQTPLSEASGQSPLTKASSRSPMTEASSQSPLTEASSQSPLTEASSQSPLTEASSQSPLTEASSQKPLTEASSQSPLTEASSHSPLTEARSQRPLTEDSNSIQSPAAPWMSGKERRALISHLSDLDIDQSASLVLTPRQKLALGQELEARRRGLADWADLSPWQQLTRDQQRRFNQKYLALPPELQA